MNVVYIYVWTVCVCAGNHMLLWLKHRTMHQEHNHKFLSLNGTSVERTPRSNKAKGTMQAWTSPAYCDWIIAVINTAHRLKLELCSLSSDPLFHVMSLLSKDYRHNYIQRSGIQWMPAIPKSYPPTLWDEEMIERLHCRLRSTHN